jgi:hypothetical protein
LITHGARKVRVTVGGKKIKGKKYGGPLPDYGTRKAQLSEDTDQHVVVIGDSIANGIAQAGGVSTEYTNPGKNTSFILNNLVTPFAKSGKAKGTVVILSSGAANSANVTTEDGQKFQTANLGPVSSQIKLLKDAGAKVALVGVGSKPTPPQKPTSYTNGKKWIVDYTGMNAELESIASANGAVFLGPLEQFDPNLSKGDGIHPYNGYKELFAMGSRIGPVAKPVAGNTAGNEGDLKTSGSSKTTSNGTPAGTKTNTVIPPKELTVPWDSRDTEPVTDIQNALVTLGYNLQVTGKIDKATRLALISYQSHNRLDVTGTANVETVKHLNSFQRMMAQMSTAGDTKTSTASSTAPIKSVTPPVQTSSKWGSDTDSTTQKPKVPPKEQPANSGNSSAPISDQIKFAENRKIIHNKMGTPEGKAMITKYFLQKHIPFNHVSGILMNMAFESGFDSGSYVAHDSAAPRGSLDYLKAGPSGGFCHWHDAFEQGAGGVRRFSNMVKACGGEDAWQMNWEKQIDFLLSENETTAYLAQKFTSAEQAATWFTKHWEFPQNPNAEAAKRSADPGGILHKPGKKE